MTEKIAVEKFRELILDMYRGFPNWRYRKMVEEVIISEDDRERLIKHGFLTKEEVVSGDKTIREYGLGPNALPLVSSWKMEELTNKIVALTVIMIILAIIQIGLFFVK